MPSPPDATIVVRHKSDLALLTRAAGRTGMPHSRRVVLDLDAPDRSQQLAWERRLNTYLGRCGCASGSIVTLASLGITVYWVYLHAADGSILTLPLLLLAGTFLSALLGLFAKILTLLITRVQIAMTVNRILKT